MKSLFAFFKKEIMFQMRSGRVLILLILFVLFGVMNPAIAKLTPLLFELLGDTLAESGMIVTEYTVTAMDSWVQFYKNLPMALIAFVLIEGSLFTKEYQSGTLVLTLTKGLERYKVVISKSVISIVLWSVGYWLCFGITYAYNAYYWDNSIANNLFLSVFIWWLFGIFVISLKVLFSTLVNSSTGVLGGVGGIVLACYLASMIPKVNEYLPTRLTNGNSLIYGTSASEDYLASIMIVAILSLMCFVASIPIFNKKQL